MPSPEIYSGDADKDKMDRFPYGVHTPYPTL